MRSRKLWVDWQHAGALVFLATPPRKTLDAAETVVLDGSAHLVGCWQLLLGPGTERLTYDSYQRARGLGNDWLA